MNGISLYEEDESMLALNVRNKILHKAVNKIRKNLLRPCVLKLFTQTLADFGETFFVN